MATQSSIGEEHVSKSFQMLLDQQPTIIELNTYARTAQWYRLGVQLELDRVDLTGCTDFTRMYQLWIQEKAEMATRRNLLTALRSLGQNNVSRLYEDYLKTKAAEIKDTLETTKDVTVPIDQRHFDKALKSGSVKARISKAVVQGPARAGKTSVKCLVLRQPYASNESTSAIESPKIAVNTGEFSVACYGKLDDDVHWELVDSERMVRKFASEIRSLIAKIAESEEDSSPSPELLEEDIFDDEMELRDLVSKAEQLENKLTLHKEWLYFIDCGGQIQFQQLVQAFIPCASVLLLTIDISKALSSQASPVFQYAEGEEYMMNVSAYLPSVDTLLRRLTLIVSCDSFQSHLAGASERSGITKVPEQLKVVAIGTHGDIYEDLQSRGEKLETIQQKEEKLSRIFHPIRSQLSRYNRKVLYQVDGRNAKKGVFDDPSIKEIRAELRDQAFEVNIPLSWYAFEIMLREKASCGILSLKTCKTFGAKINLVEAEVQSALKFFHLLNTILYYPGVSNLVFVKPESLIDVIRELVVYICKRRENVKTGRETQDMIEAAKKGFVTKNVFKNFEKCKKIFEFFSDFSSELLKIFKHLLIATEMPKDKFFMPALLPLTDPSCATSSYKFSLVYYFDKGVPLGLFCAMIVNLLLLRVDTSDDFFDDSIWSVHQKSKLYSNLITLQHYDMKGKVVFVESNDCFEIHFQYAEDKEKGKKDICSTLKDTIKKRKFESSNIECKMASFCPCLKQPRHAAILHACGKLRCTISDDLIEDPDKQSDTTSSKVMTTPSTAGLQTSSIDQPLEDTKSPDVDNIVEMTTPSTTMPQMSPKREEYTDVDTQDIPVKEDTSIEDFPKLHERPRKIDVLEQLVCIDTEWRKIGNGLRLDPNFLEGLAQSQEPNQIRLDKVLQKWMDMDGHPPCPPVTWNAVLVVLKGKLLQKHVLAKEIHQYLKPQENLKQQTGTTSSVSSCEDSEEPSSKDSAKKKKNNIQLILDKKPEKKHVVNLLANNADEYRKLAIALDVDRGFVKGLSGDDNVVKLDEVIGKWMITRSRSSPVTWRTIIEAVESDTFGKNVELADKIRDWLKEDENFSYYCED